MGFPSRDPTRSLPLVHPSAKSSLLGSLVWAVLFAVIAAVAWSTVTKTVTQLQASLFFAWVAAWIVLPDRLADPFAVLRPQREGIDVYRGIKRVKRLPLDSIRQIEVTSPLWVGVGRHVFLRRAVLLWVGPRAYVAASDQHPDHAAELGRWIHQFLPDARLVIFGSMVEATTEVMSVAENTAASAGSGEPCTLAAPRQRSRLLWFTISAAWLVGVCLLARKTMVGGAFVGGMLSIHIVIWIARYRHVDIEPATGLIIVRRPLGRCCVTALCDVLAVEVTVPMPTQILGWPPKELLSNAALVTKDQRHPIAVSVPQHEAVDMAVAILRYVPNAELRISRPTINVESD